MYRGYEALVYAKRFEIYPLPVTVNGELVLPLDQGSRSKPCPFYIHHATVASYPERRKKAPSMKTLVEHPNDPSR